MQAGCPSREPASRQRRLTLFALLSVLFCSPYAHAQDDVAEAARQERARKSATQEQANTPHVYTDEDLKRDKILTPSDQTRVEARKRLKPATPEEQNSAVTPSPDTPEQTVESLGEIARRYRQEKAAQEAAAAAEAAEKALAPFLYQAPNFNLFFATPRPLAPLNGAEKAPRVPLRDVLPLTPPQISNRSANHARNRISPFQPRPLRSQPRTVAPAAPRTRVAPEPPVTSLAPRDTKPQREAVPLMAPPLPRGHASPALSAAPAISASPKLSAGMKSVTVQHGDSWWKLAERYVGSGTRWPELRSLNARSNVSADYLRQGSTVLVPESLVAKPVAKSATITVRKGDTLWAVARQHLGRGSAWSCLAQANPEISNYTRLPIGWSLRLPARETLARCLAEEHARP